MLGAAVTLNGLAELAVKDGVVLYAAADNLFDADVEVSETGDGIAGCGAPRTLV